MFFLGKKLLDLITKTKRFHKLPVPKFKKGLGTSVRISKLTKFGLVLLHSNRPVSCQSSPKFHTNHSNSEIASP